MIFQTTPQRVVFEPERAGRNARVDTSIAPPLCFIAASMDFAMMTAAERNCEFIADLAAECPALGEPEMMRIRRPPAADCRGTLPTVCEFREVSHRR